MVKNNISGLKGLQQNMAECLQVEGCMFSRIEEKHIEDEGPSISWPTRCETKRLTISYTVENKKKTTSATVQVLCQQSKQGKGNCKGKYLTWASEHNDHKSQFWRHHIPKVYEESRECAVRHRLLWCSALPTSFLFIPTKLHGFRIITYACTHRQHFSLQGISTQVLWSALLQCNFWN